MAVNQPHMLPILLCLFVPVSVCALQLQLDPWTLSILGLPKRFQVASSNGVQASPACSEPANLHHLSVPQHTSAKPSEQPLITPVPDWHHNEVPIDHQQLSSRFEPELKHSSTALLELKPQGADHGICAHLPGVSVTLDEQPGLRLPQFYVRTKPHSISREDVAIVLDVLQQGLDKGTPFSVVWDLRQLKIPPRAVIRTGTDWMGKPENAGRLDELVQAVVILLKDPLIRAVVRW